MHKPYDACFCLFLSQLASNLVVQDLVPVELVACQWQSSTQTFKRIFSEVSVAVIQCGMVAFIKGGDFRCNGVCGLCYILLCILENSGNGLRER